MKKLIYILCVITFLGACALIQEKNEENKGIDQQFYKKLMASSEEWKFKDVYDSMQGDQYSEFLQRAKTTVGRENRCVLSSSVDENDIRTAYAISLEISSYYTRLNSNLERMQQRCYSTLTCSFSDRQEIDNLKERIQKLQALGKNIYYVMRNKEAEEFRTRTGYNLRGVGHIGISELAAYMVGQIGPKIENGTLYDLSGLRVFQRVQGGFLLTYAYSQSEVIFLKTNLPLHVDDVFGEMSGRGVQNMWVKLIGKKQYTTLFGEDKEVYAFEVVKISDEELKSLLEPYYFFPQATKKGITIDSALITCTILREN
ncbi:MAG: hypothetical protein IKP06_06205 [Elusimicrobiaceae bacterium]|nr:hypothetical protein [Elusimicrobiaceae bacterium]